MSKHSIYLSHHLQTGYTVVYEELCKALEKSGVNHYLYPILMTYGQEILCPYM